MITDPKHFSETQSRSIAKAISWRVVLTLSHVINAFISTGSWIVGLKIAGVAAVVNSILYWTHERVWNHFQFGRHGADSQAFVENNWRSSAKVISWRVLITLSNFLIPFITTGSFASAMIFLGLATLVNMLIFWSHERVWNRLSWGKILKPHSQTQG